MDAVAGYFFPGDCYHQVFEEYQFLERGCAKLALSRYLSLTVMLGSIGYLLPQIFKILKNYSTKGLSYIPATLGLAAVTFSSAYNVNKGFPFSTWGESFFVNIQVLTIVILMAVIRRHYFLLFVYLAIYFSTVWYLVSGLAPMALVITLQGMGIPLKLAGSATTALNIYRNGSTGQLSFITSFLTFLGILSRVFTTIQETGDLFLMVTFLSTLSINSIIILQFLWYWNIPVNKPDYKKD